MGWLFDFYSGGGHFFDGAFAVSFLEVHRGDSGSRDYDPVENSVIPEPCGIQGGRLDAEVGREADDADDTDVRFDEDLFERLGVRSPFESFFRIPHEGGNPLEPRIPVVLIHVSLEDFHVDLGGIDVAVFRATGTGNAVDRPRVEVDGFLRMPIAGGDDRSGFGPVFRDEPGDFRREFRSPGYGKGTVDEVFLVIYYDECLVFHIRELIM